MYMSLELSKIRSRCENYLRRPSCEESRWRLTLRLPGALRSALTLSEQTWEIACKVKTPKK